MSKKVTRCKVVCNSVTSHGNEENRYYESSFSAVTNGSKENEEFFKWTPSLTFTAGVCKRSDFEPGKEYYLDFVEAG